MSNGNLAREEISIVPEYKPALVKILNGIAIVLSLIIVTVIYVPSFIWQEENAVRQTGRRRMAILNEVEKFYYQMAGKYQTDPVLAMRVVTAARDSTRADSLFYGKQIVRLPEGRFELDVPKNFYMFFDTCFATKYQKQDTVIDTTYKVLKWNADLMAYDTVYVISNRLEQLKTEPEFKGVLGREISQRVSSNTYYRRYYLGSEIAFRPLINEKYEIKSKGKDILIKDPIKTVIKEPRFVFFAFVDTSHGQIENDERSWK